MTRTESYTLAGFVARFRWMPPAGQDGTADRPRVGFTVSDCLADLLPADPYIEPADQDIEPWQRTRFKPWHRTFQRAADAIRRAPDDPRTAHVLSMSVAAPMATELTAMIEEWIGDLPHPIRMNLAQPAAAPPGTIHGFEVLGCDSTGFFHSWLCYRLDTQARDELGIRPGSAGLLTTLNDAQQVADMVNSDDATPAEITWFPSLITEHDIDEVTASPPEPAGPPRVKA